MSFDSKVVEDPKRLSFNWHPLRWTFICREKHTLYEKDNNKERGPDGDVGAHSPMKKSQSKRSSLKKRIQKCCLQWSQSSFALMCNVVHLICKRRLLLYCFLENFVDTQVPKMERNHPCHLQRKTYIFFKGPQGEDLKELGVLISPPPKKKPLLQGVLHEMRVKVVLRH